MKENDEWKAAFRTNLALFKPTVMSFGLTNSPATFQSFMNSIFKPLIDRGVVAIYMDNILVFTDTNEQHTAVVCQVLKILHDNNLFLKLEKCVYHQPEVKYLGLIIGKSKPAWTHPKYLQFAIGLYQRKTRITMIPRLLQFLPPLYQGLFENR